MNRRGVIIGILLWSIILVVSLFAGPDDDATIREVAVALYAIFLLAAAYVGYTRWTLLDKIREDTKKLGNSAVGDTVTVSGEIVDVPTAVTAPFTEEDVPFVQWFVKERKSGFLGRRARWQPKAVGNRIGTMVVQTERGPKATVNLGENVSSKREGSLGTLKSSGGGAVLSGGHTVDSVSVDIEGSDFQKTVEPDDPIPTHVQNFLASQDIDPPKGDGSDVGIGPPDGSHQYTEHGLAEGDTVYVMGEVKSSGWEPTIGPVSDGTTIISDMDREAFVSRLEAIVYACATSGILSILTIAVALLP